MIKKATISGTLNGLVVLTAFVVMVLSMRAVVTGDWIKKEEIISGNEVTTLEMYLQGNNESMQQEEEQLNLEEPEVIAGIGSCGAELNACSIADLLEILPD